MPYHFKGSDRTKPDPALKEMQPAGVDDLENLAAALKLLQGCKACFVVATARPDHMQDGIHQPWLDRHGFKSLTLRDILPDEQDILFTDAAKVWELTLADSALPALRDHYNGSPALPVRILAFHDTAKRGTTVTAESVHAVAADLLSNDWQTAREQVRSTEPSGIYLFDALADFYLANVASRRNLVLDYAAYLARRDLAPSSSVLRRILTLPRRAATALLRGNRMAMRRTLKRLHRFGVVDQGGVLYYNDIIAAAHMNRTVARDRLTDYLPRRRPDFFLARVPHLRRYTRLTQRALVELAGEYGYDDPKLGAAVDLDTLAIRLDPTDAVVYYNRGNARCALGDLDAAIADYDEAICLVPAFAAAYDNRGNARSALGDLEAAIADYDEAIRLDPADAVVCLGRGSARSDQGDLDAAVADYDEAIRLVPAFAAAYNNRGIAHYAQGDLEAAIADHDEAIRLDPAFAAAYNCKGTALRVLQDWDRAQAAHKDALDLDANRLSDWVGLADIARRRENVEEHDACLARAESLLDPNDPYDVACFESIAGHPDLALDSLAQAVAAKPNLKRDALHDPDLAWIRDHPRFREIVGPPSDPDPENPYLPDPA